jgi:ankyrin repeat protein
LTLEEIKLHGAARNICKAAEPLLLEQKAGFDARNSFGVTVLDQMAGKGHEAMVRLPLEHKADIDANDSNKRRRYTVQLGKHKR